MNDPATERTYRAIGHFVFEFSQLEYSLKHYVGEEFRLDEKYFSAIVESYDMAMLCTIVQTVFRQSRSENTARIIDDLVNEVRELNNERVKVVHGLWVPQRPSADWQTATMCEGDYRPWPLAIPYLQTLANSPPPPSLPQSIALQWSC
jgi:hypothetical protein